MRVISALVASAVLFVSPAAAVSPVPDVAEVTHISLSAIRVAPGDVLRITAGTSRPTVVTAMLVRPGTTKALRAVRARSRGETMAVARLRMTIPSVRGRYQLRISTIDGLGQSMTITVRR